MRIIFTADVHRDWGNYKKRWYPLIKKIRDREPDVILLGGDYSCNGGMWPMREVTQDFLSVTQTTLGVLGNHDLYKVKEQTPTHSKDFYKLMCSSAGTKFLEPFKLLDSEPVIIGKVGFVGNMGWYDYTMRDQSLEGKYPLALISYRNKEFPDGSIQWSDGEYVKWDMTDGDVTKMMVKKLQEHILKIEDKVDAIVYVSHHLPTTKLIIEGNEQWRMGNAFSGSKKFEEVIAQHPKIRFVFCGHTHMAKHCVNKGVEYFNVGAGYDTPRIEEINI